MRYNRLEVVVIDKDYMEYIKTVIRGRKEPDWWVREILGVELFPKQEEIFKEFYLGGYKELDWLSGMRCKPYYSKVLTTDGYKPIMNIDIGDVVYGIKGWSIVYDKKHTGLKECIRVHSNSGSFTDCSFEHKLYTQDGWKMAKDLTINDKVMMYDNEYLFFEDIIEIANIGILDTYDICVPNGESYIADGFMNHNSGKSVLSSIIGVYEYWLLDTLENPAVEYGLIKNQPLFVMCIAPSSAQANDTLFTNMSSFVEGCEWFSTWSDTKVKTEEVVNDKKHIGIKILSSQASTGVGRTNKCVIFDEIASFEDTTSKRGAWEVYSRIRKSTQTLGRNGHVVAISSAQRPNDIMVTLWRQGLDRDDILAIKTPTWEVNPNFTKEELMDEYKDDYGSFLRDYACEPSGNTAIAFPNGVNLNKSIVNKLKTWTEPDGRMRVCAIDPALRNDGFGIAIGYKDGNDFVIDGATRFIKKTGEPYVKPSEIKEFLERVVNTYGITHLIHDTWMFPEIIEMMENKYGVTCIKHIVGFEDYKRWWEMQDGKLEGTLNITYDRVLEREASNVFVKDGKRPTVDHPSNGTKDIADCVCNILWLLTNDEYYGITGKQPIYFYNVF